MAKRRFKLGDKVKLVDGNIGVLALYDPYSRKYLIVINKPRLITFEGRRWYWFDRNDKTVGVWVGVSNFDLYQFNDDLDNWV